MSNFRATLVGFKSIFSLNEIVQQLYVLSYRPHTRSGMTALIELPMDIVDFSKGKLKLGFEYGLWFHHDIGPLRVTASECIDQSEWAKIDCDNFQEIQSGIKRRLFGE